MRRLARPGNRGKIAVGPRLGSFVLTTVVEVARGKLPGSPQPAALLRGREARC